MGRKTTAFDAEAFSRTCDTHVPDKRRTVYRCYACHVLAQVRMKLQTCEFLT